MPKGKRFCPDCRGIVDAEQEQAARRKQLNTRTWRTLTGNKAEAPISRANWRKEVVFCTSTNRQRPLNFSDRADDLFDELFGICFSQPPYVRRAAIARYIAFLQDLRTFTLDCPYDARLHGKTAGELPLDSLSIAVAEWIKSCFRPSYHPFMPCYALDAARFLEFHAVGSRRYSSETWRLKPMVAIQSGDRDLFRFLSPTFKKEFTQSMGRLLLRATVPAESRIIQFDENVDCGEKSFLFLIDRCYLSENTADYYRMTIHCEDKSAPTYDLMDEFCLPGAFLVRGESASYYRRLGATHIRENLIHDAEKLPGEERIGLVGGTIPGEWVTAVIDYDPLDQSRVPEVLPIPLWDAELD